MKGVDVIMSEIDKKEFQKLYNLCFDQNDYVKACGRGACKELLRFLRDPFYGDQETGMMNVEAITSLYHKTFP